MKRITVTLTDEQATRLVQQSRRKGLPVSAIVRDLIEKEEAEKVSPFVGFIGLASKKLPYSSADIDDELERTWADAIRDGWRK